MAQIDGVVYPSAYAELALSREVTIAADVPRLICPNFLDDNWTGGRRADPTRASRDLISVGRLAREKYQVFGLHLIAALRDRGRPTTLTIVGSGDQLPLLEEHAERLGVTQLVDFAGPTTEIVDLLIQHRAYLHTSVTETFGITLVEAMAVGLPVLAAPEDAVAELFSDTVEGRYLDLTSLERSTEVIAEVLDDLAALESMGRAGRVRFETQYSSDVTVARLSDFLGALLR